MANNANNRNEDLNIFNTRSPERLSKKSERKREILDDYVYEVVENDSGNDSFDQP